MRKEEKQNKKRNFKDNIFQEIIAKFANEERCSNRNFVV